MTTKHTRGFPARLVGYPNGVVQVEGESIMLGGMDPPIAAEVARRWNAHAALLAACEAMVSAYDADTDDGEDAAVAMARAALLAARGES